MTRVIFIALAVAGIALPAYADEASNTGAAAAASAELANVANSEQARLQLAHQGYTGISPLYRGEQGHWFGTAVKDGKTVIVGVLLPQTDKSLTN